MINQQYTNNASGSPVIDPLHYLDTGSDAEKIQYCHFPLELDNILTLPDNSNNTRELLRCRDISGDITPKNPLEESNSLCDEYGIIGLEDDSISINLPPDSSSLRTCVSMAESLNNTEADDIKEAHPAPSLSTCTTPQPPTVSDVSNITGSYKNEDYSSLSSLTNPKNIFQIYNSSSISNKYSGNLNPVFYGLKADFDKKALSKYLQNEYKKVKCCECKKEKYLYKCFCDKKDNSFLCVECAVNKNGEDLAGLSWEEEEKGRIEGFCKCKRLAHYKPLWCFLSRDKQTVNSKKHVSVNENALKLEKQCFYCRNYKRWEYLKKKKKYKLKW